MKTIVLIGTVLAILFYLGNEFSNYVDSISNTVECNTLQKNMELEWILEWTGSKTYLQLKSKSDALSCNSNNNA